MADSKSNPTNSASGEKEVKSHNLLERAKEEFEAIMHCKKSDSHHKETNGLKTNNKSKENNASLDDVRAPNLFERAKEEFEAIAQVLHHKKDFPTHDKRDETKVAESKDKQKIPGSPQEMKANIFVRAKEEIDAMIPHDKSPHRHHKETHGMSEDIDENTPNAEVKGPNVLERVKEEIEAVVQAIHPKKEI